MSDNHVASETRPAWEHGYGHVLRKMDVAPTPQQASAEVFKIYMSSASSAITCMQATQIAALAASVGSGFLPLWFGTSSKKEKAGVWYVTARLL